jgi:hypothetical protein
MGWMVAGILASTAAPCAITRPVARLYSCGTAPDFRARRSPASPWEASASGHEAAATHVSIGNEYSAPVEAASSARVCSQATDRRGLTLSRAAW